MPNGQNPHDGALSSISRLPLSLHSFQGSFQVETLSEHSYLYHSPQADHTLTPPSITSFMARIN